VFAVSKFSAVHPWPSAGAAARLDGARAEARARYKDFLDHTIAGKSFRIVNSTIDKILDAYDRLSKTLTEYFHRSS
jgi:hypothetical protein